MKQFFEHLLIICSLLFPLPVWAGQAITPMIDCEGSNKAYASQGIPCKCINGQIVCDKPSKGSGGQGSTNAVIRQTLVEGIVGGILGAALTPPSPKNTTGNASSAATDAALAARQAAELQRAKDAAFQAEHNKMMQSFKQLDDAQGMTFQDVPSASLDFKTLDGDAENLAANARKPFDTPAKTTQPVANAKTPSGATPFFGDTMPIENIRLLVNPDNDPRVVDLREAHSFIVKNLKSDKEKLGDGKPIIKAPDCMKLRKKINGYLTQRDKFYKTITMAQEQVNSWEAENRQALVDAAKDGIEYFAGELFDYLAREGQAADRLEHIYEKNAKQMAEDGLDVAAIEAKIKRLKMLSSTGRISELTNNIKDWQTFIKDGMSALISQLTSSNHEVHELLDDPKMQKYLETDSPELKTLLDISKIAAANKVFGKWVFKKVPIIAATELAINDLYHGTDFVLSFQRMTEANNINGKVLAAARQIQRNIDDTYLALGDCH